MIIESAKHANIPSKHIYVVVGESDEETDIQYVEDFHIVFCKYVNIDYNGILYFTQTDTGLTELQKYTHFFYIHDTAHFLNHFWNSLSPYYYIVQEYVKLCNKCSKNIGLFNVSWFLKNKKELFSYFINYDKTLAYSYKNGDFINKEFIYSKYNNLPYNLNEDSMFLFNNTEPIGNFFINETETYSEKIYNDEPRLITIYKNPGIAKFQKNWGQNNVWNLSL